MALSQRYESVVLSMETLSFHLFDLGHVAGRVYFSTHSTRKKMKTVGDLRIKNNGDG